MAMEYNAYFETLLLRCESLEKNGDVEDQTLREELREAFIDDNSGTVLHYAVACGHSSVIKRLLRLGCEIDSLDSLGRTPLLIAVENEDLGIVNILLSANANVDVVGPAGISLLQTVFSSQYDDRYVQEAFLLALQNQSSTSDELIDRLLDAGCLASHAVVCGDAEIVAGLLARGVDVNSTDRCKKTALHVAASRDDFELVRLLVENGADVKAVDGNGSSALLSASLIGNYAMLKFLIDHGADVNVRQPSSGWTPLFLTYHYSNPRMEQRFVDCAELLLLRGAVPRNSANRRCPILEIANDKPVSYKSRLLVAHLAMQEMLGVPIIESLTGHSVEDYCFVYPEFGRYHVFCQRTLKLPVFESLTLLDLLCRSESRMIRLARNADFLPAVEQFYCQFYLREDYPLFFKMLDALVSTATQRVELENSSVPIICDMFSGNYSVVARELIGYLDIGSLHSLNQL